MGLERFSQAFLLAASGGRLLQGNWPEEPQAAGRPCWKMVLPSRWQQAMDGLWPLQDSAGGKRRGREGLPQTS